MNISGNGGKGSARRKGANDQAYADNYDAIFKKDEPHCPKCYSLGVDFEWEEARDMWPEWQRGVCHDCDHEWNECAR